MPVSPHAVIAEVADYYKLPAEKIKSHSRHPDVVHAQDITMHLLRQLSSLPDEKIAMEMSRQKDAVVKSRKKIKKTLADENNTTGVEILIISTKLKKSER
ncbi:MAG: helix-turn-helix domain-containing protein [bacterium]|nr:helix-turn-helix domain-containing protein [bacterium]